MEQAPEQRRQRTFVYTRVMGYHRPTSFFNTGKKSEFYSRVYFDEKTSLASANKEFVKEFSNK